MAEMTRRRTVEQQLALEKKLGLSLLAGIIMSTVSCGTEDLTFPGQIPFTDTPGPTQTPTVTPTP